MKRLLKKLAGMILAVCLMVPMLGTVVFAADGVLMFSDPSTKVGENVSIDLVVQSSDGSTVGNVSVTMAYDTSALEFVSGDGFTADGSGTLTYSGTGSRILEPQEYRFMSVAARLLQLLLCIWNVQSPILLFTNIMSTL